MTRRDARDAFQLEPSILFPADLVCLGCGALLIELGTFHPKEESYTRPRALACFDDGRFSMVATFIRYVLRLQEPLIFDAKNTLYIFVKTVLLRPKEVPSLIFERKPFTLLGPHLKNDTAEEQRRTRSEFIP